MIKNIFEASVSIYGRSGNGTLLSFVCSLTYERFLTRNGLTRDVCSMILMRKPTICVCENKDAYQLRGNHFLFFLNPKFQASSLLL